MADRIAAHEEPEASAVLAAVLRDEGIDVRAGVEIERVDHDGEFHVRVDGRGARRRRSCWWRPAAATTSRDVGLETVGLDPEADTVEIDDRMRAGERLWAVGDITGKGAFTHVSRYQAAGRGRATSSGKDGAAGRLPRGLPGHVHRPRAGLGRA